MIAPQRLWDFVEGRVPFEEMPESFQDALAAYGEQGWNGPSPERMEAMIVVLDLMKGTPLFEEMMLMDQEQFLTTVRALLWEWERGRIEP